MKRRAFLERSALAFAALSAPAAWAAAESSGVRYPRAVFTKFLKSLPVDELAERIRQTLEAMKNDLATLEKWLPSA